MALNKCVNGEVVAMTPEEEAAFLAEQAAASVPVVPQIVTMRQGRLAMLNAGLLANVQTAIDGMTGAEGDAARIEWEYAAELKRTHPLVLSLGPALGLTDAQLDELFIAAAGI